MSDAPAPAPLPAPVARALDTFVTAAREAFGDELAAVVLFGSAADGQLRSTSDVNLIVVTTRFDLARADALTAPLRLTRAAVGLEVMFLVRDELPAALDAFPVKFADVLRRRRVLVGDDPFVGVTLSRASELSRLRQVLLNLLLRARQRYALDHGDDADAARAIADLAGPLRSSAAALLEVEGAAAPTAKEALQRVAAALDGEWGPVLALVSDVREGRAPAEGAAGRALGRLLALIDAMRRRAEALR